jgi:hypothetical protein
VDMVTVHFRFLGGWLCALMHSAAPAVRVHGPHPAGVPDWQFSEVLTCPP